MTTIFKKSQNSQLLKTTSINAFALFNLQGHAGAVNITDLKGNHFTDA